MFSQQNDVSLRLFCVSDIDNKIAWINNPENNQYLHYDLPLSYEKTLEWFKNKNNETRLDCVIEFCGASVGLIGLLNIDKHNRKAEYYITIGDVSIKRKGIATNATRILLEHAFHQLDLNKVYLNVDADNLAACKLYEKVGFKCEGVFKRDLLRKNTLIDRKRYAYFKEDFV